jgi:L-fucose isomerase-like protein
MDTLLKTRVVLVTMIENYKGMGMSAAPEFVDEEREKAFSILKSIGTEVVYNGLVSDANTAMEFMSIIKKMDFDTVVINVVGWAGGESAIIIAQENRNTPMIVWTTPTIRMALCGYFETTSDLRSVGRQFKPIIGKGKESIRQLESYLKAITVAKRMKEMKVGQIGDVPPGFVDAKADEARIRKKLGIDIVHVQMPEIFSEMANIEPSEIDSVRKKIAKSSTSQIISERDFSESVKTSLALEKVIRKHNIRAGGLRCLPELQKHAFPCLAVSRLSSENISIACEGDLPAAITLAMLNELTGKVPGVFDYDSIDPTRNTLRLWHCGHLATELASKASNVVLRSPTYFDHVIGPGVILSFSVSPGKTTLAKLNRTADKMLILSGEVVAPEEKFSGAYAEIRLDPNVFNVIDTITKEGLEHHICLVHGDVTSELEDLCELLSLQAILC